MDFEPDIPRANAALLSKSGPSKGSKTWLLSVSSDIFLNDERHISLAPVSAGEAAQKAIARLHPYGDTFELEVLGKAQIWVNGFIANSKILKDGDVIEFCDHGPITLLKIYQEETSLSKTLQEIILDISTYLKFSRKPLSRRLMIALRMACRAIFFESSVLSKITAIVFLIGLALLLYQQQRLGDFVKAELVREAQRLNEFALNLKKTKDDSIDVAQLKMLKEELNRGVSLASERIEALEKQNRAIQEVAFNAKDSVLFLQVGVGFKDSKTQQLLRHVVNVDGERLFRPDGRPILTLEGDGPAVEWTSTGTAWFVEYKQTLIVTNHHVVQPEAENFSLRGELEPVVQKLLLYQRGNSEAISAEIFAADRSLDLAILKPSQIHQKTKSLKLTDRAVSIGEDVIVMGYPTGLRAMVAQTDAAFIEKLETENKLGFWEVARQLSKNHLISPLVSKGIISRVNNEYLAYDAATTHGGSGGPVLNLQGEVVAINTAIIPEFGGSNLGIPVIKLKSLLNSVFRRR